METPRADHMNRDDPVWVWDGFWLPAVMVEPDHKRALVRFENGCSAPASWADVERRDPHARGRDRPRHHGRQPFSLSRAG